MTVLVSIMLVVLDLEVQGHKFCIVWQFKAWYNLLERDSVSGLPHC